MAEGAEGLRHSLKGLLGKWTLFIYHGFGILRREYRYFPRLTHACLGGVLICPLAILICVPRRQQQKELELHLVLEPGLGGLRGCEQPRPFIKNIFPILLVPHLKVFGSFLLFQFHLCVALDRALREVCSKLCKGSKLFPYLL